MRGFLRGVVDFVGGNGGEIVLFGLLLDLFEEGEAGGFGDEVRVVARRTERLRRRVGRWPREAFLPLLVLVYEVRLLALGFMVHYFKWFV